MPIWCPACLAVVPTGARACPDCGKPVPWTARLGRPSARAVIAIGLVLGIGAFWLFFGVDRASAYLEALAEALRSR